MKILTFHTTELETDTYLVTNGSEAFVVDPGDGADMLTAAAAAEAMSARGASLSGEQRVWV